MTTLASKPDWAPSVWLDERGFIYAQFDLEVLRFEPHDFLKLLKMIPRIEAQPGYVTGKQNIADRTLARKISSKPKMGRKLDRQKVLSTLSPERRTRLQEMIRKANLKEKVK